jgi:hypothetical protein
MVTRRPRADPSTKEKRVIRVCGISRHITEKTWTHSSICSILVSMRGADRTTEDGSSATITASGTGSILSMVPVAIKLQKTQFESGHGLAVRSKNCFELEKKGN